MSMTGLQSMDIAALLRSIPYPQVSWTARGWSRKVHDALRPYYLEGRKSAQELILKLSEHLPIKTEGDQRIADRVRIEQVSGKTTDVGKVKNWFLRIDELYKFVFGVSYTDLQFPKNCPSNIDCVIRYDPETDEFYSNDHFLTHLLRYLRGIDPKDIDVLNQELFPTRFGLSYGANLHALILDYRSLWGLGFLRKCHQAEKLEIRSPEGGSILLDKEDFSPVFEKIGKICVTSDFDFDHPCRMGKDTFLLLFSYSDNTVEIGYRKGHFYTDEFACFEILE